MFTFLLVVHAIIAALLVTVILMQKSEGGGLGMGGSPSGLMSARGAADFLTRATTVLASLFILMSIGLAALATVQRAPREIDQSLARQPAAQQAPIAAPAAPVADNVAEPANGAVPLAQ
ncbi:preprotein translocase subunit SecG [Sphingomonas sp. DBB INV C78]|uniref:preprotein translocase subunit SecG n=1 Tax=Sphingomonas sp. DBB INV C78 TaxID=3349434 RepID=UPI0036D42168